MLACALAVASERARLNTTLIDLSPDRAASQWAWRRGTGSPAVVSTSGDEFASVFSEVREAGATAHVLIDTAPGDPVARAAARAADLVLIPTFVPDEPGTVRQSIEIARAADTPAVVILSRAMLCGLFDHQTRERLIGAGFPCASMVIHERAAYRQAFAKGKTACEVDPDAAAAEDTNYLSHWVNEMRFRIRSGPRPAPDRLNRPGERCVQITVEADMARRLERLAFGGATTVQAIGHEALKRLVDRHDVS